MLTVKLSLENAKEHGFKALSQIEGKYIEVTFEDGKTSIRTLYLGKAGQGNFYINDTRYQIEKILTTLPEAKSKEVIVKQAPAAKQSVTVEFPDAKPKKEEQPKTDGKTPKHPAYDTIKTCIEQDIPVYLVGEAGTGKNHTLQEIANELGLTFYFTNSIQQEYKVTGFIDAGGVYHETEFYRAFKDGGLFFLDEMDASIPEVLVLLNAAIANRYFEFPNGRIDASPDFRVVSAGNTLGSGANELYTGRLVLDSATLDRFAVIEFDYDRGIELALAKGNVELVNFIRSLRKYCKQNGVRGTFSYRMIQAVTKLEAAGMFLDTIIKIAVVKGLDEDTIKTLKVSDSGRYYHALKAVQDAVRVG